ncbi:hypothetical protein QQG09_08690 [Melissococcus plutonius]|uniref:hypothetical protein n=1 Tax=Melissococcus plutonius TaxID=33970 RepID=UPI0021E546E6|nr:hypothetical protein [Melissococcus plutonius]MCV2505646.1 hypothetical protein [Melissococcus plutonius]
MKLNEELPLDPENFRKALIQNFHLLNIEINLNEDETLEGQVKKWVRDEIKAYDDEIHDEIRRIILNGRE